MHRLTCSAEAPGDGFAKAFLPDLKSTIMKEIPRRFVSMEHFTFFLGKHMEIAITTVSDSMLMSVPAAIDRLFVDYECLCTVSWKSDMLKSPEKTRIEVREDGFKYVEINSYRVLLKDDLVFAVGIERQDDCLRGSRLVLKAFARADDTEKVESLFGEDFETLLMDNIEIKGGKFTGDQRIIKLKEKLALEDLVLEDAVRTKIEREIFSFFKMEPVYRKAGLPFKRGVALYGPPGTGKTMLAKVIASVMEETVIWVKAGDIATVEDINRIFRLARIGRPSVIILEDLDFCTEDRDGANPNKVGTASLMSHLDGLEENDGILVVITTNRIEHIEKAIIDRPGRIDSRVFMGELGRERIAELLEKKLRAFGKSFDGFMDVVPPHSVMTGSMVVELSTAILRHALEDVNGDSAEIIIREIDVRRAFKDFERTQNTSRVGFGRHAEQKA
jgi:AAA+ superfamily predicted ATPase